MMIDDRKAVIRRQLGVTAKTRIDFDPEHHTELIPARLTPVPDGERLPLDGKWRVEYRPFDESEAELTEGFDSRPEIVQPGKVFYADPEAEKNEIPNWNRVTLEHIDEHDGAIIVRRVAIPESWRGKRILLRFGAIYPAGIVYVNGRKAAEQFSGLTPLEIDVTDRVVPGSGAVIAVRLLRKHRFVRMDMPRHALEFAGLAQGAYLFALPPFHLTGRQLSVTLDPGLRLGRIAGKFELSAASTGTLTLELRRHGKLAARREYPLHSGQTECRVEFEVPDPELWSDEFPRLYELAVRLDSALCYTCRVGFRRLDLTPDGPRLNGNFIKFRGVNHLTFHPEGGLYTPKEWLRENLELMKKANVNAIRTHFSGPPALLELCDEMGFYVLQEIPIDWGTNYIHDPEWVGPALHRIESIVCRDRLHPSVMVWCVGNENMPESVAVAADGWNHLRLYDEFCRQLDPTRPTMFPPPGPANKIAGIFELRVGELADTHYSFNAAKKFLAEGRIANPNSWEADHVVITREEALQRGWSGCWFSSEWGLANMIPDLLNSPSGNVIDDVQEDVLSCRNSLQVFQDRLEREWGFMREEKTCLGGAYFPWLCAAAGDNPWGWMRFGEDADWGVVCADLTPKPFFWALRAAFSPVRFPARLLWRKGQKDVNFEIWNQFNSIDLKECTLRVQSALAGPWMTMMRRFTDLPVSCPPGERVVVHVPLPDPSWRDRLDAGEAGGFRFTLLKPDGFKVIVAETLVLPEQQAPAGTRPMPIGPDAVLSAGS